MTTVRQNEQPVALTIAGFDPSGGAGIIADVKTFVSFGCRPVAAVTSLTFQNSEGVFGAIHETAASLRAQILPVVEEFRVTAVKTGMLPTREILLEVARLIQETHLPAPVVDPVLRSSSAYELIESEAIEVLMDELVPLARVITPNIPEAEKFTGLRIDNEEGMRAAARRLRELGARAVLIKGGHLELPAEAVDVLDDEGRVTVFSGEWIDSPPARGTGCMLSSAIAACLAKGKDLEEAIRLGKRFVTDEIRRASELRVR